MSKALRTLLSVLAMGIIIPLAIFFVIAPLVLHYFGVV
jgi:hypothetical protein